MPDRHRVSGMGFRWSLNPYRGCVHGCHYCFARRFHSYFDLEPGRDFTGVIYVKVNSPRVVGEELSRRSWKREEVLVGTATDPYQPIEGKYRLTRQCLEMFATWRSPVSLVTKGTMMVRDVHVLQELSRSAGRSVCFSVTTLDTALARRLEPGTPPPLKRLQAMERLVKAGVRAGVALSPIIAGMTDGPDYLRAVASAAGSHGARFLWGNALYLKPGTKEHFFGFLEKEFPELLRGFQRDYRGAYAPGLVRSRIQGSLEQLKLDPGLVESRPGPAEVLARPRQLGLGLS